MQKKKKLEGAKGEKNNKSEMKGGITKKNKMAT